MTRREEDCACAGFALWYADLMGIDSTEDQLVCECGHSTSEHIIGIGRCLGVVEVTQ